MKNILIVFIPLILLSCIEVSLTSENIELYNLTDFNINVSFEYDTGRKDTFILTKERNIAGINLYSYDYNKKTEMDSIVLLSHVNKLKIYRTIDNDTIHVNPDKYNKYSCWNKYFGTDMNLRWYSYVLYITSDMFE